MVPACMVSLSCLMFQMRCSNTPQRMCWLFINMLGWGIAVCGVHWSLRWLSSSQLLLLLHCLANQRTQTKLMLMVGHKSIGLVSGVWRLRCLALIHIQHLIGLICLVRRLNLDLSCKTANLSPCCTLLVNISCILCMSTFHSVSM
jgi:hypothetical protein